MMRKKPDKLAENGRIVKGPMASQPNSGPNGAYLIEIKEVGKQRVQLVTLQVIASDGKGWDHVSVVAISQYQRCPSWEEMCLVKRMFFRDDELVLQFHPPKHRYVNCHPHCLHLWRPQKQAEIELPPVECV
jgi:hypothetical protein